MAVSISESKVELSKKFNNPFLLSFVLSWLIWNWEGVLFFLFHDTDVLIKIGILKDTYISTGKTFVYPLLVSPVIVLFVNSIDTILDLITSKYLTQPRLNQRVRELDFSHDNILKQNESANAKNNVLIKNILNKVSTSEHIKRKFVKDIQSYNTRNSKLEPSNSAHHKFTNKLSEILKTDFELIEFIHNDYGKNINNYMVDQRQSSDLSDVFDIIDEGYDKEELYRVNFKEIQF